MHCLIVRIQLWSLTNTKYIFWVPCKNWTRHEHIVVSEFLSTTAVYSAQSYVFHIIFMRLSQDTLFISHDEWSRCDSCVHNCVRPLPSAWFPHAAAQELASLPSWNKSLRHSHGASASWSRAHILPVARVQPCPTYEQCRSAWMRGRERNEHTHRKVVCR